MCKIQIQIKDQNSSKSFTIIGEDSDVNVENVYYKTKYFWDEIKESNSDEDITLIIPKSISVRPKPPVKKIERLWDKDPEFKEKLARLMNGEDENE